MMGAHTPEDDTIGFSPKPVFGMTRVSGEPLRVEPMRRAKTDRNSTQGNLFGSRSSKTAKKKAPALPAEDNTPEGLRALLAANAHYREVVWPEPYNRTTHRLHLGDARDLSWISSAAVHLVVTSPPYWTLKEYAPGNANQMGHFEDYELFLEQLDRVWRECERV